MCIRDRSIVIENDGEDRLHESVHPYDFASMTNDERINLIWTAGMVGHGGATFPTHVKIKGDVYKRQAHCMTATRAITCICPPQPIR